MMDESDNSSADNSAADKAPSFAALFHSPAIGKCREFGLVLEAMGFDSHVTQSGNRFYLLVEEHLAERAFTQLRLYVAENAEKEVLAKPLRPFAEGYIGAYLYAFVLLLVAGLESASFMGHGWQSSGVAHSEKIFTGEWWRTITALTLHADAAHLIGNIGFGALFGLMVSQYIGRGAAWFSILMAGAIGNGLNAYFYQTLHLSIGASTMVFAALGILGIFAINDRNTYFQTGLRRWAPLFATIALLGFLGASGERTDLMAHLLGYASGCMVGMIWMLILKRTDSTPGSQSTYATATLLIVALAWAFALSP